MSNVEVQEDRSFGGKSSESTWERGRDKKHPKTEVRILSCFRPDAVWASRRNVETYLSGGPT